MNRENITKFLAKKKKKRERDRKIMNGLRLIRSSSGKEDKDPWPND